MAKAMPSIMLTRKGIEKIMAVALRLFAKEEKLMRTGLPQPKRNAAIKINPKTSMCLNGFGVSRPCALMFLSPKPYAVMDFAYSWAIMAIIAPGRAYKMPVKVGMLYHLIKV